MPNCLSRWLLGGLLWTLAMAPLRAQWVISLANPSFEQSDFADQKLPLGWELLFESETVPDILPNEALGVLTPAPEGRYFLGLATRPNRKTDAIGQRLSAPLKAGQRYRFRLMAARAPTYYGQQRLSQRNVNFEGAVVLRIYGGSAVGGAPELLAETPVVGHYDFRDYLLWLRPQGQVDYLVLQAYYDPQRDRPYYGNILIDDCSDLVVEDP